MEFSWTFDMYHFIKNKEVPKLSYKNPCLCFSIMCSMEKILFSYTRILKWKGVIYLKRRKRPIFHPDDGIEEESFELDLVLNRVAERFVEDKEDEAYKKKIKKKQKRKRKEGK